MIKVTRNNQMNKMKYKYKGIKVIVIIKDKMKIYSINKMI